MASRQSFPAFAPERFAPTADRPLRAKARLLEHLADIQPPAMTGRSWCSR